jgi:hypothetical protein
MAIVYGYTVLLEALIWCYVHFEKGGFIWGLIHFLLLVFWREWGDECIMEISLPC